MRRLAAPFARQIDVDGDHDDRADDDVLDVGRDLNQVQPVGQHAEDENAHQRAADAADTAGDLAAADHHGGDGIQLLHLAESRLPGNDARGQHHAGDAGEQSADDVDQDLVFDNVDAGEDRRLLVAAHGIDVAAEARAAEHEEGDDEGYRRDHGGDRYGAPKERPHPHKRA